MRERPWLQALAVAVLAVIGAMLGIHVAPPQQQPPVIPPPTIPPQPPTPDPKPQPPAPEEPKPDTLNAIVQIGSGRVGCSATVIGPRRPDGRYWVLSAAHCVEGTNQHWSMKFRNGRTAGAIVVNFDRKADYSWMLTESNTDTYPFALLAESSPPPGTPIWHSGFGVDRPGNREDGVVTDVPNTDGQIRMRLSVSSGDSGGGICVTADGRVFSTVCCTSGRGQVADVWGSSTEALRRGQVAQVRIDDWQPLEIPLRMPPK